MIGVGPSSSHTVGRVDGGRAVPCDYERDVLWQWKMMAPHPSGIRFMIVNVVEC